MPSTAGLGEVVTNLSTEISRLVKGGASAAQFATRLAAFINKGDG